MDAVRGRALGVGIILATGSVALGALAGCNEEEGRVCTERDVQLVFEEYGCTTCHATGAGANGGYLDLASEDLLGRLVNQNSRSSGCASELLVDLAEPEASVLLKSMDPERYADHGSGECSPARMPLGSDRRVSKSDVKCVESWIRSIAGEGGEIFPAPFDPAPPQTVASKVKYLLHGGAVTQEELATITADDGSVDTEALKGLIDGWTRDGSGDLTPQFETKLRMFLELSLQQRIVPGSPTFQFQNQLEMKLRDEETPLDRQAYADTIPRLFVDTAVDLVRERGDVREVVTTRRWRVTTAILAALVYADHPRPDPNRRPGNEGRFGTFAHLTPEDYSDWRFVNLAQATTSQPPEFAYENTAEMAAGLRGIGAEGTVHLWAPRVGFFNTIVFFDNWETNPDNQFRVTLSQTLAVALDAIYETGDPTTPPSLESLDPDHSLPGTACYECHKLLDPARPIYDNYYSYNNRAIGAPLQTPSTFGFQGHVVEQINNMDDLASAIAGHPRFAAAWTQKLCMWANSQRCDESDPQFVRVAETFRTGYDENSADDDFSLDVLVRELFASTLITGAAASPGHEEIEFLVSPTRFDHFCQSVNVRLREASDQRCAAEGLDPTMCEAPTRNCFGSWKKAEALGQDAYARGIKEFTTPTTQGPVYSIAVREACRDLANNATGNSGPYPRGQELRPTVTRMVETLMGLPQNHPRHDAAVDALVRTYQILANDNPCPGGESMVTANADIPVDGEFVCGGGLNRSEAMQNVFVTACSSPDFMAIGF